MKNASALCGSHPECPGFAWDGYGVPVCDNSLPPEIAWTHLVSNLADVASDHESDIREGRRFAFGDNWARFLTLLDDRRIALAEQSLRDMFGVQSLVGRRFLDVGSGSGLFSLAARRLGATVHSFDFDPRSVACTEELKRRYFPNDKQWQVEEGSVLQKPYLDRLGTFDIVYSWGVLHHTGSMYQAFENIVPMVAPGGQLFIAIYNDQGQVSKYWLAVKKIYNKNVLGRCLVVAFHAPYLIVARWFFRLLMGRGSIERGMSLWFDMIDWLGGLPFEVARPETILRYFRQFGFQLCELKTCGGRMGCNEFVFRR